MIFPDLYVSDPVPEYPLRKAFREFYPSYTASHTVSRVQEKAAACISRCKTGELGYTASYCPECGYQKIRARSCNNRSCPCCQAPLEQKWVMERNSELISGIAYYHVIFTLPKELNSLMLVNQKVMYDLLFSAATQTLLTLCMDKQYMGAVPGIVSVLHTWGQTLSFHPHLHVMLSGGGLNRVGKFVETKHKGFIIPVKVLGKMFRGKFLDGLKTLRASLKLSYSADTSGLQEDGNWKSFLNILYSKTWVPFVKETFNGNGNAVKYLARYAYRTAISNSRIREVTDSSVVISYTDYADSNQKKELSFSGEEFVECFLRHILPQGFHRVRFSGFLANCVKSKNLTRIGILRASPYAGNPVKGKRTAELLLMIYGSDICTCPNCHHQMITGFMAHAPDATVTE
ncbi:MAG: IS91 family transposase [Oribacterium sp.]|nr:IS91 family transposase [Oribacterium sp.]